MKTIEKGKINISFYHQLKGAVSAEDIICMATLVAIKQFDQKVSFPEIKYHYDETLNGDCMNCPAHEYCLACSIND